MLHVRIYACDACGLVCDRDDNAALNLAVGCAYGKGTRIGALLSVEPWRRLDVVACIPCST